ncbi:MAG TPA: phosphotransferase [Micromonosporaceae bacterium]
MELTWPEWIAASAPSPLTAPIEVIRERPWSMVAKVPTAGGPLWFKENRGDTRYETYLLAALAGWVPHAVLTPIAVDHERGWSLQPDGGTTVYESGGEPDARRWEELLSRHADLQRRLIVHVPEMLAAGVPDQRPAGLMARFDRLPVPAPALALRPSLARRADELAASRVPPSLQHDDLHDNNVFRTGEVFDWGDASIAHPFSVLLISLRVAADQLSAEPGDAVLARIRDAYLEPWSDLADRAELVRDVDNAIELGKIGRALAWQRSMATEVDRMDGDDPVAGWLGLLTG